MKSENKYNSLKTKINTYNQAISENKTIYVFKEENTCDVIKL